MKQSERKKIPLFINCIGNHDRYIYNLYYLRLRRQRSFFSLTPPPLYLYWLPIQQFPAGPCAMLLTCENSNIGPSAVYIYYRIWEQLNANWFYSNINLIHINKLEHFFCCFLTLVVSKHVLSSTFKISSPPCQFRLLKNLFTSEMFPCIDSSYISQICLEYGMKNNPYSFKIQYLDWKNILL